MAVRREVWSPPSVVVEWCDELDSLGEEMSHEWLSLWPSGLTSEREGPQHSWWEVSEVRSKPWLLAEPLVDLNTIKEMDDKRLQWMEPLLQGRHSS